MADMKPSDFHDFVALVEHDKTRAAERLAEEERLLHARSSVGETALHYLAIENDIASVQWLLARGADINTTNEFGGTPLMDAAKCGYIEMCRFLVEQGADSGIKEHDGDTALSNAAWGDNKPLLEFLLEQVDGADVNDFFDDVTAEMVLDREDSEITELLRARGLRRRFDQ